ncbi:MAG: MFS transporter [Candidatus Hodarchaeales archaeon]
MNFKSFYDKNILLFFLILFSGSVAYSIIIPMIRIIEENLQFNYLGTVEAIFILVSTFSLFFWGYVSDKYSRKLILIIGFTIVIVSNFLIIFVNSIELFTVLRISMGIGLGTISPVSYSLASDFIKINERSTVLGGSSVATISGSGIGIILGGIFGSIDWKIPFILIASFFLLVIIIFLYEKEPTRGKEEPELKEILNHTNIDNEKIPVINKKALLLIFKRKTNLSMIFQGTFALIPSATLNYYLISYLTDSHYDGLNIPLIWATILGLSSASGRIFGFLIWGYLGDYLHAKLQNIRVKVIIVTLTMGIQIPIIILAFFSPLPVYSSSNGNITLFLFGSFTFISFMMIFFVGTLMGGASGPNRRSLSFDINEPEVRGSISSLFTFSDQIGASIGIFIASILIPILGYSEVFIILVLFGYGIAMILWIPSIFSVEKDSKNLRTSMKDRAVDLSNNNL